MHGPRFGACVRKRLRGIYHNWLIRKVPPDEKYGRAERSQNDEKKFKKTRCPPGLARTAAAHDHFWPRNGVPRDIVVNHWINPGGLISDGPQLFKLCPPSQYKL